MSCGQKKQQQNNEGGVHLTERTCSPYNPIIKQIVDDCLGLPIYPVSSIDAVIDEDGNTLRKLLDELVTEIRDGNYNITNDIDSKIVYLQEFIEQNYTNLEAFEELKTLLYAISALKTIESAELEKYIFVRDENSNQTPKPYIVKVIEDLQAKIRQITGEGGDPGDTLSLRDIIAVLVALANFDEHADPDSYNYNQLEDSGKGTFKIIQEILNLKEDLNKLLGTTPGDDPQTLSLAKIKALLIAVAGFNPAYSSEIDGVDTEDGVLKIIQEILNLKECVGLDPDDPTPDPEPDSLLGRVKAIEALLKAVANYNYADNTGVNLSTAQLGLEMSEANRDAHKLIEVIYRIKDAIERLEVVEGQLDITPGGGGGNTITHRIEVLEEESKTHAHLDPYVKEQMPENVNPQHKHWYEVLKYSEYPPTSAQFWKNESDYTEKRQLQGNLNYFGFFKPVTATGIDFYPVGHANQSIGHPLFYATYKHNPAYDTDPTQPKTIVDEYHPIYLNGQPNTPLRAGDGIYSSDEILLIIKTIQAKPAEFQANPQTNIPSDLKYSDLYICDDNNNYCPLGDTRRDGETNIGDVNYVIQKLTETNNSASFTLPGSTPGVSQNSDWLCFIGNDNKEVILYPCTDGKIYTDVLTGDIYRFDKSMKSGAQMLPLNKITFEGNNGIEISKSLENFVEGEDMSHSYGPYTHYNIRIADNTLPNTILCKYVTSDSEISEDDSYEYFLEESLYQVIPTLGSTIDNISIEGSTVTVNYNINNVTALIDILLSPSSFIAVPKTIPHKKQALLDYLQDKKRELQTEEQINTLNQIITHLTDPNYESSNLNAGTQALTVIYATKGSDNSYKLNTFTVSDKFYIRSAYNAMWDFNRDGSVNIEDVTQVIDHLLTSGSQANKFSLVEGQQYPYIYPIPLGARIVKKDLQQDTFEPVVPMNSTQSGHKMLVDGRLFRVVHNTDLRTSYDWYYFDDQYVVRPLNPKFDIDYESATGYLILSQNGVQLDDTLLTEPKISSSFTSSNSQYPIINLGPNSTPYLFGSGPFDYNAVGDASTNTDMCFLDEDGNFVASAGETLFTLNGIDLYNIYNDNFLTYYISQDQGQLDALDISPEQLMSSNNDCTEISIGRGLVDYSLIARSKSAPYKFDLAEKVKYLIAEGLDKMQNEKSEDDVLATLKSCFNTPNEGIVTQYHCLNCHHSVLNGVAFIDKCYLYEVKEEIHIEVNEEYVQRMLDQNNFSMTHFPEFVSVDASITLLRTNNVQEGVTYYFPKFGLQLKFKNEVLQVGGGTLNTITPVVVYVESEQNQLKYQSKCMLDRLFRSLYIIDPVKPTGAIVDVKPNEYLNLGLVDYCIFDFSKFTEIPGNEVINVSGRFRAGVDSMPIELIPSSIPFNTGGEDSPRGQLRSASIEMTTFNPIQFAKTCPSISHGHTYEYHMQDGIFSFVDVTPTSTAQVIDEGWQGSTQK